MNLTLFERFKLVNEWLRFAEAKNAAFIALNGGAVFGIVNYFPNTEGFYFYAKGFILILLLFSILLLSLSFIPRLKVYNFSETNVEILNTQTPTLNTFFFADFAKLTGDQLLILLKEIDQSIDDKKENKDLAEQIVTNSRIIVGKLTLFCYAVILDFSILVLGIISIFLKNV